MVKRGEHLRDFTSRNHTIITALRHRQVQATLIKSNKRDIQMLVGIASVIYVSANKAKLAYKHGNSLVPSLRRNAAKLHEKTATR